ncbi:endonuclease VII domain-containing protein [Microbispora sp. NPDC049633]|uniref:endonuclease VII domain-containing protein n=1 Tax=Microbispora sp. NPDC049633 TaxID=3154355 RepID=UPI003412CFFC
MREYGSCGCVQREKASETHTKHGYHLKDAPRRAKWLWAQYRLAWEDYLARIEEQQGKCAICPRGIGADDPRTHVDHDHESGNVRGILCHYCNLALGYMEDDAERMRRAAEYIERTRSVPD